MKKPKNYCINEGCNKTATFNLPNEKAHYCKLHQLEDMIDVRHKKCNYPGCTTNPSFNYVNEMFPLYCSEHKLYQMININNKKNRCQYENCQTIACYNLTESKKGLFCDKHKSENMVDVKNKSRCVEDK